MPLAPHPICVGPLEQTVNALGSGGSFSGKSAYIEGARPVHRIGAERKYNNAVAKGYFPLTSTVANVDLNGAVATANVTATPANGELRTMPLTFVQGPSPTGWQLIEQSLLRPRRLG